jgi:hypothetical protein
VFDKGGALVCGFIPLLLLLPSGDAGKPLDKGKTVQLPEVRGVIAGPIRFPESATRKVAAAGLALLASCHYAHHPNEGAMPDWDDTLLDCMNKKVYLYIRFPEAQEIKTECEKNVQVSEMIIVLRGTIWVRWGDKAKAYGKYEKDRVNRLQLVLKEAEPAP